MTRHPSRPRRDRSSRARTSGDILAAVTTRALALQEVALALAEHETPEEMAAALLPTVAGAVGAREAALLVSEPGDAFRMAATHGVPGDLAGAVEESAVEQAAASVAANTGHPLLGAEIEQDESFVEWRERQAPPEGEPSEGDGEGSAAAGARPYFELYAPLQAHDAVVGVLALGRRADGQDFTDEDLIFIEHVGSGVAVALSRSHLDLENRRKIEMLRALARFTGEITSTLDLNRVLHTVANTTEAVIDRDRALVVLVEAGGLKVRAVSDKVTVEVNEAEVLGVREVLDVIHRRKGRLRVTVESVADESSEVPDREVFARYFEAGEMQSILVLPLQDEEGLLGYLVLESRDPAGFGDAAAEEFLGILSGSVSVAIRNADLYRRVPMVGFLAPIAGQRRRLAAMSPNRRRIILGATAAATLFLVAVPLPRHAAGPALVRPSEVLPVVALAPGIVEQVYASGGDEVVAGAPIAALRNRESDARLAEAEAELSIAERRAAEATERRDPAEARRWSLQAKNLSGWMSYARSEGADQRLAAPVTGSILTPRIGERVGEMMERGDALCEIARLDPVHVEVQVSEEDIGDLAPGGVARVKVLAYPDRQFRGKVLTIAPEGSGPAGKPSSFTVTVECANPDLDLLAGMTGRAKVEAGWTPWLWSTLRPLGRALRMNFWF
ncbi:MAG TPA: efflux RND transporter periplasmic adaptor subunit [Candidatus Eisenbacteria bacterium]|nr:efflux RND transporter periplasmic adaptor subunit [Candidatus Eisenbacteria bacterium]